MCNQIILFVTSNYWYDLSEIFRIQYIDYALCSFQESRCYKTFYEFLKSVLCLI